MLPISVNVVIFHRRLILLFCSARPVGDADDGSQFIDERDLAAGAVLGNSEADHKIIEQIRENDATWDVRHGRWERGHCRCL